MSRTPRGSSRRRVRVSEAAAAAALFAVFGLTGCADGGAEDLVKGKNEDEAAASATAKGDGGKGGDAGNGGTRPKVSGSPAPDGTGDDSGSDSGSDDQPGATVTDKAVPASNAVSPIDGVVAYTVERTHEKRRVVYDLTPPAGGVHNARWLNCGIYRTEQDASMAVHSMEHGAVWVTYRPDLPNDQVAELETLLGGPFVLLTPYDGLPAPVVASAWGVQLALESPADPRLAQFVSYYREGPQTPEPGAPCTGGVGSPR
ncbi:DUF3105 domain-containing protein [Streptodolium elevatio]